MIIKNQTYIILDLETGGLSYKENPITQIALIAVDSVTLKEITRFESYVKPYDDLIYEEEALKHTGITKKEISLGASPEEVVNILISLLTQLTPKGDRGKNFPIIVGHNISFDIPFLKYLFKRVKKRLADFMSSSDDGDFNRIDTLTLARLKWSDGKHNLGACCRRIGIDHSDAHRAMSDVLVTWKLLVYLQESIRGDKKETKEKKQSSPKGDGGSEEYTEFKEGFQF